MKNLPTDLEAKLRAVIDGEAALQQLPERQYCDVVLEALEGISSGLEMRLEELDAEDDDEDGE